MRQRLRKFHYGLLSDKILNSKIDLCAQLLHSGFLIQVQLKFLAEEMQEVSKSLEKIEKELEDSETDGPVSENFRKVWVCFV